MKGLVFDIKEWAVFDGPGVRTTVFLKGCPLHCSWCHNPEGISPKPQLLVSDASCIHCHACEQVCPHGADPVQCTACGECVAVCPLHLRNIAGTWYEAKDLANLLQKQSRVLKANGGGVTFSGGEPLYQHMFLKDVIGYLDGVHIAIETSGHAQPKVFQDIISLCDYILMDLKVMDAQIHQQYCGQDNHLILKNLTFLKQSGKPFVIRIPVIPQVNDTLENFEKTAQVLEGAKTLQYVELLPYQKVAGAKYQMLGQHYRPGFDEERKPNVDPTAFERLGIPCRIL